MKVMAQQLKWKCEIHLLFHMMVAIMIRLQLKDNFVNSLDWFYWNFIIIMKQRIKLKSLLLKIGKEIDLLLNDWDLNITIDLKTGKESSNI